MAEALTDEIRQRRIEVLRDLLERIGCGHLSLARETYFAPSLLTEAHLEQLGDSSCRPLINQIERKCPVCLRGGVLFSKIRCHNGVSGFELAAMAGVDRAASDVNVVLLADTFDMATLGLMEAAFMGDAFFGIHSGASPEDSLIMATFGRPLGKKRVAIRIATSMIENRGELVVSQFVK